MRFEECHLCTSCRSQRLNEQVRVLRLQALLAVLLGHHDFKLQFEMSKQGQGHRDRDRRDSDGHASESDSKY